MVYITGQGVLLTSLVASSRTLALDVGQTTLVRGPAVSSIEGDPGVK